jgi:hypothetical protein
VPEGTWYVSDMKKFLTIVTVVLLANIQAAHAGDGAMIVFKSGVVVNLDNGYKQLVDGMKGLKAKGSENYPVEIQIEGTSFFINLGEVTVLCRDRCSSLTLVSPPKQGGR